MKRLILSTFVVAAAAAAHAPLASADCTIATPASVMQYWPTATYVALNNDIRCDHPGGGEVCHLSGWLYKPTAGPTHDLPAIVYAGGGDQQTNRHDTCEIVNYFVAHGYVVYVPYMMGQDDNSPSNANAPGSGFHNTGTHVSTWVAQHDGANPTAALDAQLTAGILAAESDDMWIALVKLTTVQVSGHPLVDLHKIAVMGHGYGGFMASELGASNYPIKPAAIVSLSGGALSWDNGPSWPSDLDLAASAHVAPVYYQELGNETPDQQYTAAIDQFTFADAVKTSNAKLALYGAITPTASTQAICDARGYPAPRCASYAFVTDDALIFRWIDNVGAFLVQYGVK